MQWHPSRACIPVQTITISGIDLSMLRMGPQVELVLMRWYPNILHDDTRLQIVYQVDTIV